ncbi:MAG: thermonuclease family protein [Rhodospirillaceae bacterium]|nr:thermonuclease family protein [Rhodospirillaceae bacterium]
MLAAALLATVAAPPAAAEVVGTATVIDGDTIEIHGRRIRLFGIDAPESAQLCAAAGKAYRCGQRAALALAEEIGRATVDCDPHDVDRYGRIVAVCTAAGRNLNAWMVRHGWALAYQQYSSAYVSEEEAARAAGLGLWRGSFAAPWTWRRKKATAGGSARAPAAAPAPRACPIKGDIGRGGEHIYHVPGQRDYDRARIDESRGERWFCTEAEARAAGWRKARR